MGGAERTGAGQRQQASVAGAREVWRWCSEGLGGVGLDPQQHTKDPGQSQEGAER